MFFLCFLSFPVFSDVVDIESYAMTDYSAAAIVDRSLKEPMFNDDNYFSKKSSEYKENLSRLDELYYYLQALNNVVPDFPKLDILGWNKMKTLNKVKALKNWLNNLKLEYREILGSAVFNTDKTRINFELNKVYDEFDEKVKDLKVEKKSKILKTLSGENVNVEQEIYNSKDGKVYKKTTYNLPGGKRVFLEENNQIFDKNHEIRYNSEGMPYLSYKHNPIKIPEGYVVARDRSEHLKDKGKHILVPLNDKLRPAGTSLVNDNRGGYVFKSSGKDDYNENGTLKLKPDINLTRVTEVLDNYRQFNTKQMQEINEVTYYNAASTDLDKLDLEGPKITGGVTFGFESIGTIGNSRKNVGEKESEQYYDNELINRSK